MLIRDMLIADDVAVTAHSEEKLQRLMDIFFLNAHQEFSLAISLKKSKVMVQGVEQSPAI